MHLLSTLLSSNHCNVNSIVDNEDYNVIEFDLDIDYEGTENSDVLTIGAKLQHHRF